MDYIIKFSDPTNDDVITVKPYTVNGPLTPTSELAFVDSILGIKAIAADTTLVLLGKGMHDYGNIIASNFVHLLENFAGATSPTYPIKGQLWYKTDTSELRVFDGTNFDTSLLINGKFNSHLNLFNAGVYYRIINIGNPVNNRDAVNLQYANQNYLKLDGTNSPITGTITLSGGTITGVPTPVNDADVANKAYVTSQLLIDTSGFLLKTGGNLTGDLFTNSRIILPTPIGGFPTNNDVVNKGYVDGLIGGSASFVHLIGDTMTGPLVIDNTSLPAQPGLSVINGTTSSFNGDFSILAGNSIDFFNNVVKRVGTPIINTDGANKAYVDTSIVSAIAALPTNYSLSSVTFSNNTLTFTSGPLTPIIVNGVASVDDLILITDDIHHNMNQVADRNSILRNNLNNPTFAFPNVALNDIVNIADELLYDLTVPNDRLVYTAAAETVVGVVTPTPGPSVNGAFIVSGDVTTKFTNGVVFTLSGNTNGPSNGVYTTLSSSYSSPNTTINLKSTTPFVTGTASDGIITPHSIPVMTYLVEYNKLQVFKQGIKQYNSTRGQSIVTIPNTITYTTPLDLVDSTPYSFDIKINGGTTQTITVTTTYTLNSVIGVNTINNFWTINSVIGQTFERFSKIEVINDTILGTNTTYTVDKVIDNGITTIIYVFESIGAAAGDGSIIVPYLLNNLISDIQTALQTIYPDPNTPAVRVHNNNLYIISPTSGTTSSVEVITGSLFTLLSITDINNSITGETLDFSERGIAYQPSNLITFPAPLTVGNKFEITYVR